MPSVHRIPVSCRRAFLATLAVGLTACGGGGGGGDVAPAPPPPAAPAPQVTMTVSNGAGVSGDIVITLDSTRAPVTTANFLAYVNAGFYNGTVFHRNARDFVLQGGGYLPTAAIGVTLPVEKTPKRPAIALEVGRGLSNVRLSVAMARTGDPNSATSEFFINLVDNVPLDTNSGGYAVFGNVTAGEGVVAAMAGANCTVWAAFGGFCYPNPNLVITSARQTR